MIVAASVAAAGGGVGGESPSASRSSKTSLLPQHPRRLRSAEAYSRWGIGSRCIQHRKDEPVDDAVSIGFVAGPTAGAAAVAGVKASHDLKGKFEAQILGSVNNENSAVSGVTVKASNKVTSDLDVKSASVAAAVGGIAGALSVSVASATTTLEPEVSATIRDAKLISSGGNIAVTADNTTKVTNNAATASVAAAIGLGFSIAGGSASATVTATPKVDALVQNSDLNGKGVSVFANSTDTVNAESKAAAISIGLVGLGAAGSKSNVTLTPELISEVARTKVVSDNGTLNIQTKFTPMATAESAGLAVSTGAAVGVSRSDVTIGGSLVC